MGFVNIKIKEEFAADLINSLYGDLEDAAKEIVEKNAVIERLETKLENDSPTVRVTEKNIELLANNELLIKELEEKDLMIEKLGKYHLELEMKHSEFIENLNKTFEERLENEADRLLRDIRELNELVRLLELKNAELKKQGAKVVSDDKLEAERDKLVKLVTQLQEENAELKMIMKMAGDKPGKGRPKKA